MTLNNRTFHTRIFRAIVFFLIQFFLVQVNAVGQNSSGTSDVTHGPMLGNVTSSSIRVWARTKQPSSFKVLYSENSDLSSPGTSEPVSTSWEHDLAAWSELKGLKGNTKYYYAIQVNNVLADTKVNGSYNSFTTLPDAKDFVDAETNPNGLFNFSFEIGTGNSQGQGRTALPPTFENMLKNLKDKIYFQIQNGDWIYEDGRDLTAEQWTEKYAVGAAPSVVNKAKGITGVWENYKVYLGRSKALSNFYREVPQFVTLDDHEILNDVMGSGEIGFRLDSRGKPWQEKLNTWSVEKDVERAVFRDPALQAWDDYIGWANPDIGKHQPIHFGNAQLKKGTDVITDKSADFTKLDPTKLSNLHIHWGFGNTGVYQIVKVLGKNQLQISPAITISENARYSIGTNHYSKFAIANAEFYLLDTRSYRTLHDKTKPDDPNASMLGKAQEEWLLDGVRNSKADFIFIVSSVNLAIPHDNGAWYGQGAGAAGKDDGWTAQLHQREKLLKVVESLQKPVFILTGDLHKSFVARVTPSVYDIGSGPHTSGAHRLGDAGGSPPSGWYQSGNRQVNMLWSSTQFRNDSDRKNAKSWPIYTVIRFNNVYSVPDATGKDRWIAHPEPQVIIEFHDGYTGDLSFAYTVSTSDAKTNPQVVPLDKVKVLGGIVESK